ncbi:MAG: PPOX class F420-dependent oxidoreductase [Chloroflexota bacterium]|nr:PPOX class F420-dependent oxidoreductase [Chloroflexota bacterium]
MTSAPTLNEAQQAFLREPQFAVVATIAPDGMPHQTVMWYLLEGDGLLLNTPHGSLKHKHLQRDKRISVCVERGYQYITLAGTVTLAEDPAQAGADYGRLGQHYASTFAQRPAPGAAGGGAMSQSVQRLLARDRVTLRLEIEKVQSNGVE